MVRTELLLGVLAGMASGATASAMTCGDLKAHYKKEQCCGSPEKALSEVPGAGACPYNFAKPACDTAEPQAPRDLTTGAAGLKDPKAATLNKAQAEFLPQVNVHFHYGAEHKSDNYKDDTESKAYDASHSDKATRRLAADPRPGFMCPTTDLTEDQLKPYTFQHCKGKVEVGKSYELHYVHSSAGYTAAELEGSNIDGIADGLGGAANGRGLLNPMIVVEGQVFQIVNGAATVDDMLHGWKVVDHSNSVMYPGSTTGPSHDNEVCSPYAITWHVDKVCHQVSPESFDKLCKDMKDLYKMEADLYPHGSRKLLDEKYVVKAEYVKDLA